MNKDIGHWVGESYKSIFNGTMYKVLDLTYNGDGSIYINVLWDNGQTSGNWEWNDFYKTHIGIREVKE